MNPCIKKMQYAVRGPLVIRATEIEKVRWLLNESISSSSSSNYFLAFEGPKYIVWSNPWLSWIIQYQSLHTWYEKIHGLLSWIAVIGCPSKSKRNCSDSWNCAAFWQPATSSHRWTEYLIRLEKHFSLSFHLSLISNRNFKLVSRNPLTRWVSHLELCSGFEMNFKY